MGFFKKSKKSDKNNDIPESRSLGWDSITAAFLKLYPGQEDPLHYGTIIPWSLGGNDPITGISVYNGDGYYHFVTYGFSELYEKESKTPEYSGFGFELTFKLKIPENDRDGEIRCVIGNLQGLARYIFKQNTVFRPNEYIYTGQQNGIDLNHASKLTGFITALDEAGEIETPNGKLTFVQLVGATDAELQAIIQKQTSVSDLLARMPNTITDYNRESML